MKNNKRMITMVSTLCALILLFVVYKMAASMNDARQRKEAEELAQKDATIMIAENDYRDAVALSYQKKGGEEISLAIKDSRWVYVPDNTLPINQTTAAYMANALASMAASSIVDLTDADVASFGLDDPAWKFSVTYKNDDGSTTSHSYVQGNFNEFSKGYYFQELGTDTVYMIFDGLTKFFEYDLHTIADAGVFPIITEEKFKAVDITVGDSVKTFAAADDSAYAKEFVVLGNTLLPANFIEYHINDETLAKYGLDTPSARVDFRYTETITVNDTQGANSSSTVEQEQAFRITLGDTFEMDGKSYTAYLADGYTFIYFMPSSVSESLLSYFAAAES